MNTRQTIDSTRRIEARLEESQRLANIGSWELDLLTNELWWSEQVFRIFRIDSSAFGASYEAFLELIHPDDRETVNKAYLDSVENRQPYDIVHRLRFPNGDIKYVQERCETHYDQAGRPLRSVGTVQDISERVHVERTLREREAHLRTLVETIPDLVWLKDPEGVYLACNPKFERFFGAREAQIVDKTDFDFVDQELATFFREKDRAAMAAGQPCLNEEWVTYAGDGHRELLETIRTPMQGADGQLIGVLGIARDITERKRAEADLQRTREELEQRVQDRTAELRSANAELEAFAYSVSHDLRAPLRAIVGFSQALEEDYGDRFDGEAKQFLDLIVQGGMRMSELIDGVLTLSRSSRGELDIAELDLSAMAADVLAELTTKQSRASLSIDIQAGMVARGDSRLLRVVMTNLLDNALKYTGQAERPSIRLFTEQRDDGLYFCVKDNGAGFDMSFVDKLFGPFQRLHHWDDFPGLGIGLATVKRIVSRHGGHVSAEGTPGEGAAFCFSLDEAITGKPEKS